MRARVFVSLCFAVPALLMLVKLPGSPWAPIAWSYASLEGVPRAEYARVEEILLVPLAALVVAIARLVFGVRMLSLFRPILLTLAFRATGIVPGIAFLAAILGAIVTARPVWSKHSYYVRIPFLLTAVAVPLLLGEVLQAHSGVHWLAPLAAFPIIALGLTCEAFVKVLHKEGLGEAFRQTATAAAVATGIVLAVQLTPILPLLMRYPELLLAEAGLVLALSGFARRTAPRRSWFAFALKRTPEPT